MKMGSVAVVTVMAVAVAAMPGSAQVRPGTVDILGIRLGASPNDVVSALKAMDPGRAIEIGQTVKLETRAGSIYAEYIPQLEHKQSSQEISAHFFPASADNVLTYLFRTVHFPRGNRPTIDAYVGALQEKYGQFQYQRTVGTTDLFWLIRDDGTTLHLTPRDEQTLRACTRISNTPRFSRHSTGWWSIQEIERAQSCSAATVVKASFYKEDGFVSTTFTSMLDVKRLAAIDAALKAARASAHERDVENERGKAKAAPKPKL